MLTGNDVRTVVDREITALLAEATGESGPVGPADGLYDLGLDSLLLARLVITLEGELGVDPFAEGASIADVRTPDDLTAAYERALTS
ncbi:acyl carrier protein [Actinomadura roseirufa]|uniref:acyl carrier protein n=1 Tax=Actinomadura roseirufa TaxID=2094049 RepID=UPI0010415CC7|nr:acyl carrier protein [Actinomadura roseirufa]